MPKIESIYGQDFILPPYIFPRILLFESCFQYNSIIFELFVYSLKYLNHMEKVNFFKYFCIIEYIVILLKFLLKERHIDDKIYGGNLMYFL